MKEYAFRLQRGEDLKVSIEKYVKEKNIKAGVIISCVGCLYKSVIRNAGGKESIVIDKDVEIVSVTGTLSLDGCHIHLAVSDEELKTYGGHLKDGCLVNTTVEIILLELDNYTFKREMDNKTGYKELVISDLNNQGTIH